ncbi:MAG: cytochrome c oxidase accessory protein CcoG [Opitutaceae bacterium]|nr:cytochrome c oxidase accessory protein CcoG [Opitutaceae bacterium]
MSAQRPSIDSVTTINDDGSRHFLHPADTRGRWTSARRIVAWVLIAVYILLPWIPVGGYPAVFLDVAERRFHLFGWTIASQEMWLLFFLITGLGFTLFFVTALLGRVWCGWACPQTVFLEFVYRAIERLIDGDAPARRRLDAAPWDAGKVARRIVKHTLFVLFSAAIAHLFLSYFVSLPHVYAMVTSAPTAHWGLFLFMMAATAALYGNFAWFREQLCIVICPYGRLQSALVDDNTLVVGYDAKRGEPRRQGRAVPSEATGSAVAKEGDCIDCLRCVHVCPTGIDIRQGLQLECLACTACIDACDDVMVRLKKPRGLIRYDSLSGFAGVRTRWLRPRTILYAVLLAVGSVVTALVFSNVKPVAFATMRMPGGAYFLDADAVRNQLLVRLTNKTTAPRRFTLSLVGAPAALESSGTGEVIEVALMEEGLHTLIVRMPRAAYAGKFRFKVTMRDEAGGYTLDREVEFLGPDPKLLQEDYWREKSSR